MYKKNTLVILLLLSMSALFAQNDDGNSFNSYYSDPYANVVPQTPNAATFTQYGNTPVNLSSGLPTISIPIYTLQVDGVSVPISISYHASGVKVDDVSSVVGLKWTLNAGGGVFRSINDLDDFESLHGWTKAGSQSHFDDYLATNSPIDYTNSFEQGFISQQVSDYDNFPDSFNYSFLNYSGSFVHKPNGDIVKGSLEDQLSFFGHEVISDVNGNTYNFGSEEENEVTTVNVSYGDPNVSFPRVANTVSWMLDNINTRHNKNIDFEYTTFNFVHETQVVSQRIVSAYGFQCDLSAQLGAIGDGSPLYLDHHKQGTKIINETVNKLISKITTDNVVVDFIYTDGPVTINGSSVSVDGWDKRITKIVIKDLLNNKQKEFRFTYEVFNGDHRLQLKEVTEVGFDNSTKPPYIFNYNQTALPDNGSFAKDIKGFYNGKSSNNTLLPKSKTTLNKKFVYNYANVSVDYPYLEFVSDRYFDEQSLKAGVLEKIQYPTGGKTEFIYEPNAIGVNLEEPQLDDGHSTVSTGFLYSDDTATAWPEGGHTYSTIADLSNLIGQIKFYSNGTNCPLCDLADITDYRTPVIRIYKYNGTNPNTIDLTQKGDLVFKGSLHKIITEEKFLGFNDSNNYTNGYMVDGYYLVQLKLHPQTYNPNDPNPPFISVGFDWVKELTDTNGDVVYQENYFGGMRIKEVKDFDSNDSIVGNKKYKYNDGIMDQLYNSNENIKELGGQIIFSSDRVYEHGRQITSGYCYTDIEIEDYSASVNGITRQTYEPKRRFYSMAGGDILSSKLFDENNDPVQFTEYEYEIRPPTTPQNPPDLLYTIPSAIDKSYGKFFQCVYLGVTVDYPDRPYAGYNSAVMVQRYHGNWRLPKNKKTTSFYKTGTTYKTITTVNDYDYNDDLFTIKETSNAKYSSSYNGNVLSYNANGNLNGEEIEVFYEYPSDFSNENTLNNIPEATVVTKKVYNNNDYILGEFWEFVSGDVKAVYRYNQGEGSQTGAPSYVPSNAEEISRYKIDANGKPIEVKRLNGTATSYIWGYNGEYLMAKIENKNYASIPSNLKSGIINANYSTMPSALSALRTDLSLQDAMITTFTYDPLKGLTTVTDPKGDVQTYTYDGFGKLKQVKDKQDKILQEYNYNYGTN